MQFHTTGLTWNPKVRSLLPSSPITRLALADSRSVLLSLQQGKDASTFTAPSKASTSPAAAASSPTPSAPKGLFAELGGDVTKGLKKVDKSEMTHKNPELRASSVVPANGAGTGGEFQDDFRRCVLVERRLGGENGKM